MTVFHASYMPQLTITWSVWYYFYIVCCILLLHRIRLNFFFFLVLRNTQPYSLLYFPVPYLSSLFSLEMYYEEDITGGK